MAAEEKDQGKKAGEKFDPIVDRSLAPHFLVSSGILALTVLWALYTEVYAWRPYKHFQGEFQSLALEKAEADREAADKELEQQKASAEYQQASARVVELEKQAEATSARRGELERERDRLTGELNKVRGEFAAARGDYQPLVYELDHAKLEGHRSAAEELQKKITALEPKIQDIFTRMQTLAAEKNKVQAELATIDEPLGQARRNLSDKVPAAKKLADAKAKLGKDGPLYNMEVAVLKPYQIYNPALGVIDRCTSCHIAADKPGYTKADWEALKGKVSDAKLEEAKEVFATHPDLLSPDPSRFDWLGAHAVTRFGCTSCHWGNGPATTSAEKAHGLEGPASKPMSFTHPMEFQLTPLLPIGSLEAVAAGEEHFGNMMEASCSKCHTAEVKLRGAPQLSYARQLVDDLGCWGCHKIKGFEVKELELAGLQDRVAKELEPARARLEKEIEEDATVANRSELVRVTHEIASAERRMRELDQEVKFIGPDLNRAGAAGLKSKIYWAWLPRWIWNPQHFRPGTWMPNPLIAEEEVLDVAAYVWQQAQGTPTDAIAPQGVSDALAAEGKLLVQERGCVACHTLDEAGAAQDIEGLRAKVVDGVPRNGEKFAVNDVEKWWADPKGAPITDGGRPNLLKKADDFAPSLAKVGEKIRYEWLVEWVKDPKAIQPHTRMPSLRLDGEEARKIASYLTTLRSSKDAHPGGEKYGKLDRATLEDPKRAASGFRLVVRAGCFNCHSIDLKDPASGWKPIANPGKIGAELSSHGSKPLAQFDFGFVKVPETRNVWLETKILEPRIWDRGKYKGDPNDRLRMPRFGLNAQEAAAVTTVLVGLTDTQIPGDYVYRPNDRAAAIIEGERLVRKFNCRSCHVIDGEGGWGHEAIAKQVVSALKLQNEDDAVNYLPPVLNGQGHRTEPGWLFKFLKDPAAYTAPANPIRPWHVVRMPSFEMSDAEATALVAYFSALEKDPYPYVPREVADSPDLVNDGRRLFSVEKGPQCHTCHMIGDYVPKGKKPHEIGPNLAQARDRLRGDWIERFIPDPQASLRGAPHTVKAIPGVNMPSFFQEKPFAAQPPAQQRQIQALRAYVRALADPEVRRRDGWTAGR